MKKSGRRIGLSNRNGTDEQRGDGAYREPEFRMFHNDLIGEMPLPDQRGDDRINAVEIFS